MIRLAAAFSPFCLYFIANFCTMFYISLVLFYNISGQVCWNAAAGGFNWRLLFIRQLCKQTELNARTIATFLTRNYTHTTIHSFSGNRYYFHDIQQKQQQSQIKKVKAVALKTGANVSGIKWKNLSHDSFSAPCNKLILVNSCRWTITKLQIHLQNIYIYLHIYIYRCRCICRKTINIISQNESTSRLLQVASVLCKNRDLNPLKNLAFRKGQRPARPFSLACVLIYVCCGPCQLAIRLPELQIPSLFNNLAISITNAEQIHAIKNDCVEDMAGLVRDLGGSLPAPVVFLLKIG